MSTSRPSPPSSRSRRVMLLLPKTTYRTDAFVAGAARAEAEVVVASDVCHVLHETWQTGAITVDFDAPEEAAARIVAACRAEPVRALVPVTEASSLVAALAAEALALPYKPPSAASAARNKRAMRQAR